ncbi:MAG: VWA domain-containing protein [Phycisphaerales bacterium JB050]
MLQWLFDLDTLSLSEEGVRLGFERPFPGWAWFLIAIGALALGAWSYRRLSGSRPVRFTLAGLRTALLILLVLFISGPQLVDREETFEEDWVLVLIDRSASLQIEDIQSTENPDTTRITRDQQLRDTLERTWDQWSQLSEDKTVLWLGFDSGAYDLPLDGEPDQRRIAFQNPTGRQTRLGTAIDQALARAAARSLSSVVIITDGRSTDDLSRAALRRLRSEQIPVHAVALGSTDPVGDIAIRFAEAPPVAFVGDLSPVSVTVERVGGGETSTGATVRLIDTETGETLDEQEVIFEPGASSSSEQRVLLKTSSDLPGDRNWRVEVVPDGADLIETNNTRPIEISLVDRPIRVLYLDGYPRWEQRYLRSLLLREESIDATTLILSPERRYIQDSNTLITDLPASPEEWAEYDAIMIGDMRPEVLTIEQMTQIREHVALRGGGLIWAAGPSSLPSLWFDTPLADLLPFSRSGADGSTISGAVLMQPTPVATDLGVLRLAGNDDRSATGWPEELSLAETGWSLLRYAQYIEPSGLKPAAQILASAKPVLGGDDMPLLLLMRYGSGRSLYLASDETWRWRFGRGEVLFERFWIQLIRMLGRDRLARSGQEAILTASPNRAIVQQPVRVSVELLDQALIDTAPPSITVEVERSIIGETDRGLAPLELVLAREAVAVREEDENAQSTNQSAGVTYSSLWLPPEPGLWSVVPTSSLLTPLALHAEVEVALPDDELRHPETDHERLALIAEETGGSVVLASDFNTLPDLPNRATRRLFERTESLWDTPIAMILVLSLLTLEWVGRRIIRLI